MLGSRIQTHELFSVSAKLKGAITNKQGDKTMARENSRPLDSGDNFPRIEFDTVEGSRIILPDHLKGNWSVFLIYRGSW